MNPQNSNTEFKSKKVFVGKTKSNPTIKNNRVLPVFHCKSCGNCETHFHKEQQDNDRLGFCVRFKENVGLEDKNISCWTKKENTYYKDLFLKVEKEKTAIKHIEIKKVQQFSFDFDNQLNPFE